MREQRIGARRAVRKVERCGQSVAACAFELETFGGHDVGPQSLRPLAAMTPHRLASGYTR